MLEHELFKIKIKDHIDSKDNLKRKSTPLQIAARKGYPKIVKKLLKKGASNSELNAEGKNALQIAMDEGHENVIEEILSKENGNWQESLRKLYTFCCLQIILDFNIDNLTGRAAISFFFNFFIHSIKIPS